MPAHKKRKTALGNQRTATDELEFGIWNMKIKTRHFTLGEINASI